MRDNKPLELEALNLSCYKVSKFHFKWSLPNYDTNGGDFFILEEHTDELFKVIRCQAKGRNITNNNSNLKIDQKYVDDNFLIFLYLKHDEIDEENIYLFTKDEIMNWEIKNGYYYLNIPMGISV